MTEPSDNDDPFTIERIIATADEMSVKNLARLPWTRDICRPTAIHDASGDRTDIASHMAHMAVFATRALPVLVEHARYRAVERRSAEIERLQPKADAWDQLCASMAEHMKPSPVVPVSGSSPPPLRRWKFEIGTRIMLNNPDKAEHGTAGAIVAICVYPGPHSIDLWDYKIDCDEGFPAGRVTYIPERWAREAPVREEPVAASVRQGKPEPTVERLRFADKQPTLGHPVWVWRDGKPSRYPQRCVLGSHGITHWTGGPMDQGKCEPDDLWAPCVRPEFDE